MQQAYFLPKSSAEKFPGRGQQKKDRKIALLSLLRGGNGKKTEKLQKRPKNSTINPLSTISVPCMKIQAGHVPLPPAANTHASYLLIFHFLHCISLVYVSLHLACLKVLKLIVPVHLSIFISENASLRVTQQLSNTHQDFSISSPAFWPLQLDHLFKGNDIFPSDTVTNSI